MVNLKIHDIEGGEVGEFEFCDHLLNFSSNAQLIKDYLVALRHNSRQFSANTKGRAELCHSNAKPRPQKGTGRSRQGTIKAPQYRGGGTVFGPKPKLCHRSRINRKQRRLAIRFLLAEKLRGGDVSLLKLKGMSKPKTKSAVRFLERVGIMGQRVLFLSEQKEKQDLDHRNLYLSMRNVPKISFMPMKSVSGYDVIKAQNLIVVESAVDQLMKAFGEYSS